MSSPPKVLRVAPATKFVRIWKDRGSGSKFDVTIFRPIPPPGFHILGDIARPYHDDQPRLSKYVPGNCKQACQDDCEVLTVAELNPDFPEYLRKPVDYQFIWDETRTGAYSPCTVWKPVPPPGFVVLGYVVSNDHNKPSLDLIRCVHHTVTLPGRFRNPFVYKDEGSGGKYDLTIWAVDAEENGLSPGTWIGMPNHDHIPGAKAYNIDKRAIITEEENEQAKSDQTYEFVRQSGNSQCPRCDGKGGIGAFGPCELSHIHFLEPCPTCAGEGILTHELQGRCDMCEGKGGIGFFGACDLLSLHYKECPKCKGQCYLR